MTCSRQRWLELAHEGKADVPFDESQQVGFRNLIFQAEVVEQRFRAVVLSHHDQQAPDDRNQTEHGRMLSSSILLLNLILLIDVIFQHPQAFTPTTTLEPPQADLVRGGECNGDFSPTTRLRAAQPL